MLHIVSVSRLGGEFRVSSESTVAASLLDQLGMAATNRLLSVDGASGEEVPQLTELMSFKPINIGV